MMRLLGMIPVFLYRLACVLGIAALVAMTAIVCLNIIARAAFNSGFSWSEELARFLMIWSALCGAAMAVRRSAHFRMDLAAQFGFTARWIERLPALAAIVIGALLAVQGHILVNLAAFQLATATQIPMSFPYWCLPFSGMLMMVFGVEGLLGKGPGQVKH